MGSRGSRGAGSASEKSYQERRSEISQKYRQQVTQRDVFSKIDKIKQRVQAIKNIEIRDVLEMVAELENLVEVHK